MPPPDGLPSEGLADLLLREHRRFTGDGLPGEPLNAPLPYGDPRSGTHCPPIKAWRDLYNAAAEYTLSAWEAADIAEGFAEAIVTSSNVPIFSSRTFATGITVNPSINTIRVNGYASASDGGAAMYQRRGSEPAHPGKFQDAAGAWWEITRPMSAMQFGFGIDADNDAAFGRVNAYLVARGGRLLVPEGDFTFTANITITGASFWGLYGAGIGRTIFRRGGTAGASFFNLTSCSYFEINGITINPQRGLIGVGSHGIRMDRCPYSTIRSCEVLDWSDTAILHIDSTSTTVFHDGVLIEDCFCTGTGDQNNGIMLNNTRVGIIRGCFVRNVGRSGSPGFALQLKQSNDMSRIENCTAINARAGIAIGGDAPNTDCRCLNNTIIRCSRAVRIASSSFCHVDGVNIDMTSANDLLAAEAEINAEVNAIYMSFANNCSVSGAKIRGHTFTSPLVWIRQIGGALIEIDNWNTSGSGEKLARIDTGATVNTIIVKTVTGGYRPTFISDAIEYNSTGNNTVRMLDGVNAWSRTISGGTITLRDRGCERVRVDTESTAATDDLDTISGGVDGQSIVITPAATTRQVVVRHGQGNIYLKGAANRTLSQLWHSMELMFSSAQDGWIEV